MEALKEILGRGNLDAYVVADKLTNDPSFYDLVAECAPMIFDDWTISSVMLDAIFLIDDSPLKEAILSSPAGIMYRNNGRGFSFGRVPSKYPLVELMERWLAEDSRMGERWFLGQLCTYPIVFVVRNIMDLADGILFAYVRLLLRYGNREDIRMFFVNAVVDNRLDYRILLSVMPMMNDPILVDMINEYYDEDHLVKVIPGLDDIEEDVLKKFPPSKLRDRMEVVVFRSK